MGLIMSSGCERRIRDDHDVMSMSFEETCKFVLSSSVNHYVIDVRSTYFYV